MIVKMIEFNTAHMVGIAYDVKNPDELFIFDPFIEVTYLSSEDWQKEGKDLEGRFWRVYEYVWWQTVAETVNTEYHLLRSKYNFKDMLVLTGELLPKEVNHDE